VSLDRRTRGPVEWSDEDSVLVDLDPDLALVLDWGSGRIDDILREDHGSLVRVEA